MDKCLVCNIFADDGFSWAKVTSRCLWPARDAHPPIYSVSVEQVETTKWRAANARQILRK